MMQPTFRRLAACGALQKGLGCINTGCGR